MSSPLSAASGLRAASLSELKSVAVAAQPWLWRGYLARGAITLLTSQWKTGKTTLLSVLLARLGAGGELAGLPVRAGRAVVVSEEPAGLWVGRAETLDFGEHVRWLCRPFDHKPDAAEWQALIDYLALLGREQAVTLAAIDPLAAFLPGDENNAAAIITALLPLRRLTEAGMAVCLMHHPGKHCRTVGMLSRGSGALGGHSDVLLEMTLLGGAEADDRRRRLRAFSRFRETPPEQVIELNEAGTDYAVLAAADAAALGGCWPALTLVLSAALGKLTRADVLTAWPRGHDRPSPPTLWRSLERGVAEGLLLRDGAGTSNEPFRYWLPEREAVWRTDPRWQAAEQRRQDDEALFRSMAEANGCSVADLFTPGAMARRFERAAPGERKEDRPRY